MVFIRAIIGLGVALVFTPAIAQETGLSEDNIKSFYEDMQNTNFTLKEGREDLPKWLAYLDKIWTDDFRHTTNAYNGCETNKIKTTVMTKNGLKAIYQGSGVQNFQKYEINVLETDISADGLSANVHYTLDIQDIDRYQNKPTYVRCDVQAQHIWNAELGRQQIKSQTCDQRYSSEHRVDNCDEAEN